MLESKTSPYDMTKRESLVKRGVGLSPRKDPSWLGHNTQHNTTCTIRICISCSASLGSLHTRCLPPGM